MKKIDVLSAEASALLPEFREQWRAHGLRTGATNRALSADAVKRAYAWVGQPAPMVLHASGPLEAFGFACILRAPHGQLWNQLRDQLRNPLRNPLRNQLRNQLSDQLRDQLWDQLRNPLRNQLWDQLRNQLGNRLRNQLGNQLSDQLWDQLRNPLSDQLRNPLSDQLRNQLREQLWDQLRDQLRNPLRNQLRNQLSDQLRNQLSDQLGGQLGNQLWDQLWDQLSDQLWDQLWDQLGNQLREQLRNQLREQLRGQLREQLRGQRGDQLWDQLGNQLWNAIWSYGQAELYWSAYYRFAIDHAGVVVTDRQKHGLAIWEDMGQSCSLVLSWPGVSIIVDHPQALLFNELHRLHSVTGPAISYADGYTVYAVNGVRIDPGIGASLLAGRLTADEIRKLGNVEVRRVAVERYESVHGKGAYLADSGAEILHEDFDQHGRPRKLMRIEQGDDEPYVGVQVTNSSPEPDGSHKQYILRVDPSLRVLPRSGRPSGDGQAMTCHNAIASTFGRRGEDYAPAMET